MTAKAVTHSSARYFARRVLTLQSVVVLLLAGVWVLTQMTSSVSMGPLLLALLSVLLGGLSAVCPNVIFVWRFFSVTDAQASQRIIMNFYSGEILKLLLSIGFLLGSLLLLKHWAMLNVFAVFSGFLIAQVAVLVLPWVSKQ